MARSLSSRNRSAKGQALLRRCRLSLELLEGRVVPSIFTVTNTNDSGPGSLRQAILNVNADTLTDTIAFNIGNGGVQTICPASPLPALTNRVVIDGTTQPGYTGTPLIVLNGNFAGGVANGLTIRAGFSTVQALVVNGFSGDGISLQANGSDFVMGNLIGTDAGGTIAVPNGNGIGVSSNGNFIGGVTTQTRNVISGNMEGIAVTSANANVIQGNYIGVDMTGAHALANGDGITFTESTSNTIGGTVAGAGNLISGNLHNGVVITRGSANSILGNKIGTDAGAAHAIPNGLGVSLAGSSINTIGGTVDGARNLISGNGTTGLDIASGSNINLVIGNYIGTDVSGTLAIPNVSSGISILNAAINNTVGGTTVGARNLISGNGDGIRQSGSGLSTIQGNFIGTDGTGTRALGNALAGINLDDSSQNTIGGPMPGAGNLISANGHSGISVGGDGNIIQGNRIGTNAAGTAALGNPRFGMLLFGSGNTIGGTFSGARNLISGNDIGIRADGSPSESNQIQGNYIGTDITGTQALGNTSYGLYLNQSGTTVGGNFADAGNIISGNRSAGIYDWRGNDVIIGNFIGTDGSGTRSLANGDGLDVAGGGNIIGGAAGAGNLISGNSRNGIAIASFNNRVLGNFIGTDIGGTVALRNGSSGISIGALISAFDNTIGGTTPGTRNIISGNAMFGIVAIQGARSVIQGNFIGTDVTGNIPLGNGIGVFLNGNATLGGTIASAGNLISGNPGGGVQLAGPANVVQGNRIGTDLTGTHALGNAQYGVNVTPGSNNLIGGTMPGARNLISGNALAGVEIDNADGTIVAGNLIGTDQTGTLALPNGTGIIVQSSMRTTIGGTTAAARNLISGNTMVNVRLSQNANLNAVEGDFIGTDITGAVALGSAAGVEINGASNNTIGGTMPGMRNIISGNLSAGVCVVAGTNNLVEGNYVGTDVTGVHGLGSADGVLIAEGASNNSVGGTAPGAGNLVSGNFDGVILGGNSNLVLGNLIGTDATGTQNLGNNGFGVVITGLDNTVGGTLAGARNVISANGFGFMMYNNANGNVIEGNYIGTDISGSAALGNGEGFQITRASNNTIGGVMPGAGNLISGSVVAGIFVSESTGIIVEGNRIGTDATGSYTLGNQIGVDLNVLSTHCIVGGTAPGAGNLISGSSAYGIELELSSDNLIEGNYIGTDAAGTEALANLDGILIGSGSNENTIGGTTARAGNLISGNSRYGVFMVGGSSEPIQGNILQGNIIGADSTRAEPLGNGEDGIFFWQETDSPVSVNTIGGAAPGAGNTIAFDGHDGILIDTGVANTILRNRIFGHDNGLGIELINGGNNNQPFPTISAATFDGQFTTIIGTLASAPNTTYTIELFINSAPNPSGYGEGERFFASLTVATDADGNASFNLSLPIEVDPGQFVSATATDPNGNTSPFALCVEVTGPGAPLPSVVPPDYGQEYRDRRLNVILSTVSPASDPFWALHAPFVPLEASIRQPASVTSDASLIPYATADADEGLFDTGHLALL